MTVRHHQAALRRAVFERDHGVCAHRDEHGTVCGLDTVALLSAYRATKAQAYGAWRYERDEACMRLAGVPKLIDIAQRHRGQIKAIDDRLRRMGFEPGRSLWEADHETPIEEGGAHELDNVRTLCLPHHKQVTAEHAARRARRPSKRVARRAA